MPAKAAALLGGKLKLLPSITLVGVSMAAMPAAFISYSRKNGTNLFTKEGMEPIKQAIGTIPTFISTHMGEISEPLREEYNKAITGTESAMVKDTVESITQQWKSGEGVVNTAYSYIKGKTKDINYYAFSVGNLIKSILKLLPTILRDTIIYTEETKKDHQLLSIQKIIAVSKKGKFAQFAGSMASIVDKYQSTLQDLTMEDGIGVLKIFREVREDDYDTFMEKVTKNIQAITGDKSKTYNNSTELLKDVFLGIEDMNKLRENMEKLKKQIDELKTHLEGIDGVGEAAIKDLEAILKQLQDTFTKETQ